MGNDLCIAHLSDDRLGVRRVIDSWGTAGGSARPVVATDDTFRVLAEVEGVGRRGTVNPQIPTINDLSLGFEIFSVLAGGGPSHRQRVHASFAMSPYSLGLTLRLPPEHVRLHLDHLKAAHLLERIEAWRLPPKTALVVLEHRIPALIALRWRLRRARQKWWKLRRYRPGYMVVHMPVNLPKPNTLVTVPVLQGRGVVDLQYQGEVLTLTAAGGIELRRWNEENRLERERRRSAALSRRFAGAAVLISLASMVSITADAQEAWQALQSLWAGLSGSP